MFNLLVGPLTSIIGDTVKGFVATKKAKSELKLTEIQAQKSLKEQQIAGKVAWEASAVDQMKGSWKDEFVLLALMIPAICSFLPFMQPHIARGFEILETTTAIGVNDRRYLHWRAARRETRRPDS